MNTKIVLAVSGLVLSLYGAALVVAPGEILALYEITVQETTLWLIQYLGVTLMGFGIMNWIARGLMPAGIYGRPIFAGNLVHFGAGTILLLRSVIEGLGNEFLWFDIAFCLTFAVLFGIILFGKARSSGPDAQAA